jgi:uncharacterized protein
MGFRRLGSIAAIVLLIGLAFSWGFGSMMVARGTVPNGALPGGASLVEVTSPDGVALKGNFWPGAGNRAPGIVLLHGLGSSRHQFDGQALAFAAKGYAVLAINMRAHGDSGGDTRSFGWFEARDAHAAFAWLKTKQNGAKIGVVGMSLGGAAALLGPDGPLPADAMVLTVVYPDIRHAIRNRMAKIIGWPLGALAEPLLSYQAPLRFGVWPADLAPVTAIRAVHAPVFIIGGEKDIFTPPDETRSIFAAANNPKTLWIVPGADHNGASGDSQYQPRVEAFMAAHLGVPGTGPRNNGGLSR